MNTLETELVSVLRELQKKLHDHIKWDVKKHFSLMVADAAASKVIRKAEISNEAVEAILARMRGEYDNPALVKFGPLSDDLISDCEAIADACRNIAA